MAYVPDPTDDTMPTDTIIAETAAAEFRAIKTYLKTLVISGVPGPAGPAGPAGTPDAATIQALLAGFQTGAIGTYALLRYSVAIAPGGLTNGINSQQYTSMDGNFGGEAPGIWRCMGSDNIGGVPTLFLRVS